VNRVPVSEVKAVSVKNTVIVSLEGRKDLFVSNKYRVRARDSCLRAESLQMLA
jgi:hypothetical protein